MHTLNLLALCVGYGALGSIGLYIALSVFAAICHFLGPRGTEDSDDA